MAHAVAHRLLVTQDRFDLRPVKVRFVVYKVAPVLHFSKYFGLPLSVSFQQCSILTFILTLLLSQGQAGTKCENSQGYQQVLGGKVLSCIFRASKSYMVSWRDALCLGIKWRFQLQPFYSSVTATTTYCLLFRRLHRLQSRSALCRCKNKICPSVEPNSDRMVCHAVA